MPTAAYADLRDTRTVHGQCPKSIAFSGVSGRPSDSQSAGDRVPRPGVSPLLAFWSDGSAEVRRGSKGRIDLVVGGPALPAPRGVPTGFPSAIGPAPGETSLPPTRGSCGELVARHPDARYRHRNTKGVSCVAEHVGATRAGQREPALEATIHAVLERATYPIFAGLWFGLSGVQTGSGCRRRTRMGWRRRR